MFDKEFNPKEGILFANVHNNWNRIIIISHNYIDNYIVIS